MSESAPQQTMLQAERGSIIEDRGRVVWGAQKGAEAGTTQELDIKPTFIRTEEADQAPA
jgi:hypothetical protein